MLNTKNNSSRANAVNNIRQQNAKEPSQLIFDNLVIRNIFTDSRDGQKYKTIKLGRQEWMAENLNFYEINMGNKSRCYGDNVANCSKYGRLYTWAVAMDSAGMYSYKGKGCGYGELCNLSESHRGVCPEGWHLPNKSEWDSLWNAIGGKRVAGTKLKSTTGWVVGGEGVDDYGFAILPAGYFDELKFGGLDSCSGFWTSTEKSSNYAYAAFADESKQMDIDEYEHSKKEGRSVRCVKD